MTVRFPKESSTRAFPIWVRLVWRCTFWPFAGVMALVSSDEWRTFWVVWMVILGLVLEGMRFAADRLLDIYREAIELDKQTIETQRRTISRLDRYRAAFVYATGQAPRRSRPVLVAAPTPTEPTSRGA